MPSQGWKCAIDEDYSPCICESYPFLDPTYIGINCTEVNLPDVRIAFEKCKELDVRNFYLEYPRSTDIPADLIGSNHRITNEIFLKCSKTSYSFLRQLVIHSDAFRSSRNYTSGIRIDYCDLSRLNFSFFTGFSQLDSIHIQTSAHVYKASWESLPPLPKLTRLHISSCRINGWKKFPQLITGLQNVDLSSDDIDDKTMEHILNWLLEHATETLEILNVFSNALEHFPTKIASFKLLKMVLLGNQAHYSNGLSSLHVGSVVSSASLTFLEIRECGVNYIEPGAFSGKMLSQYDVWSKP